MTATDNGLTRELAKAALKKSAGSGIEPRRPFRYREEILAPNVDVTVARRMRAEAITYNHGSPSQSPKARASFDLVRDERADQFDTAGTKCNLACIAALAVSVSRRNRFARARC